MLTQERLKSILHYDLESGIFTWILSGWITKIGTIAGGPDSKGYLHVRIDNKWYFLSRLAFLYVNGKFPDNFVDHKDTVITNNAWNNLREAGHSQNAMNVRKYSTNKSGFKGVSWHKDSKKWRAKIKTNGHEKYLGYFDTPEEASKAYENAVGWYHGKFARTI